MLRFRGGLVFKAHRLLYHSTLGLRVIKKKDEGHGRGGTYHFSSAGPSSSSRARHNLSGPHDLSDSFLSNRPPLHHLPFPRPWWGRPPSPGGCEAATPGRGTPPRAPTAPWRTCKVDPNFDHQFCREIFRQRRIVFEPNGSKSQLKWPKQHARFGVL